MAEFNHHRDDTGSVLKCLGALLVPALMALLIFLASRCRGAEIRLRWSANPSTERVSEYRIYRGIELLAFTPGTRATVEAEVGDVLFLIACRDGLVSVPSAPFVIPMTSEEKAIFDRVKCTIEFSSDLQHWHDMPRPEDRFFRVRKELLP